MKQENKAKLTKYIVCFCIASVITVIVFGIKGFFIHSPAVNMQILADGFFVSGTLMTLFAGMMYVSGEGALIGIQFIIRNVALAFVPMGRKRHELYKDYRERKLKEVNKSTERCILLTGLVFLIIGIIFTTIWYVKFYNNVSI